MKALYALLLLPLMNFSSEPPAQQTPRIGQVSVLQEESAASINALTNDAIARAYIKTCINMIQESQIFAEDRKTPQKAKL